MLQYRLSLAACSWEEVLVTAEAAKKDAATTESHAFIAWAYHVSTRDAAEMPPWYRCEGKQSAVTLTGGLSGKDVCNWEIIAFVSKLCTVLDKQPSAVIIGKACQDTVPVTAITLDPAAPCAGQEGTQGH